VRGRLLILALGLVTLGASAFLLWAIWHYQNAARNIAWLEDQHFDTLSLVTVGTGNAYENPSRLGPVSAVGLGSRIALVDAGRGVAEALRRCEIRPSQPDTVLLTSLLPENIVGIDDLLATGWRDGRTKPLRLLGPPGTRALAAAILAAQAPARRALGTAAGLPEAGARLDVVEVRDGYEETRDDGLVLRAASMGTRPLPSLAWRMESDDLSLVVAGSGADPDALATFARGAELLAVEGFLREAIEMAIRTGASDPDALRREADLHLDTAQAGTVASRADVPLLVLTRLQPPPLFDEQIRTSVGSHYSGRVAVADDCDSFSGSTGARAQQPGNRGSGR
jgi:ribonuclease BN (tRNA processing enzyme)